MTDANTPEEIQDEPLDIELPDVSSPAVIKHEVNDDFKYDVAFNIGFVGLGQGGGNMAETFYKLGYRRVGVINTAVADLKDVSDDIEKLDLGTGGAGQDMEKGKRFLKTREEDVRDLLTRAIGNAPDYLIICVSLGGGTGSGGAGTLIEICRKHMEHIGKEPDRVGVLLSLPNPYEGQRTSRNAIQAYREIHNLKPSPLIIIDNKQVEKLYHKGAMDLYPEANAQIAKLFHLFNRLAIQRSQLMTFDRADYANLLDNGTVVFGASPIPDYETSADITRAIRDQLEDTVLAEVDLSKGTKAGCIFLGGEKVMKQVSLEYFGEGFSMLSRILAEDSMITRGVYVGSADDLRCYTMISGLHPPKKRLDELAKEARLQSGTAGMASHLGVDD